MLDLLVMRIFGKFGKCTFFAIGLFIGMALLLVNYDASIFNKASITTKASLNSATRKIFSQDYSTKSSERRTDAVILLTQRRSGSSIVGEIFNQRTDVTYFYEPLFPFNERPCESQYEKRVEVLHHITRCHLEELPILYSAAFNISNKNDIYARCKIFHICFTSNQGKAGKFLSRDAGICKADKNGRNICPKPLNLQLLSKHCKRSLLRAMKVIYFCKIEWLLPLLQATDVNVKVVHLVRDPRATVNSRISEGHRNTNMIRNTAASICEQLSGNLVFADDVLSTTFSRDKYLRIRHEDFAMTPVETTQKIYDFIDINMNPMIKSWLVEATSSINDSELSKKNTQSTTRNATAVLSAWRKSLKLEEIQEIQKVCKDALSRLGYKNFNTVAELDDLSQLHFDIT